MPINLDKPQTWKLDIADSVDMFNKWFMTAAPEAFRESRTKTTAHVEEAMVNTNDFANITIATVNGSPFLPVLRAATCPPIARDRLSGLAGVSKGFIKALELGKIPKLQATSLSTDLTKVASVIGALLDRDLFPWLANGQSAQPDERHRAATVVADRLCGAVSNPIIRNAQEQRQLALLDDYLKKRGYRPVKATVDPRTMEAGTYAFRMVVQAKGTRIPVDVVVQPLQITRPDKFPILIECKSAGDFTNVNKRRKEEAQKIHQIRQEFQDNTLPLYLFLCGYFDAGYLGYSASEQLDWIWEHRISDLDKTGI